MRGLFFAFRQSDLPRELLPRAGADLGAGAHRAHTAAEIIHRTGHEHIARLDRRTGRDACLTGVDVHVQDDPGRGGVNAHGRIVGCDVRQRVFFAHDHLGAAAAHVHREPAQLRQAQDHIVAHEVVGKPRPVCARAHAARIQTAQDLPGRERLISGHVDAPDKERRYRHRKHQQKQHRTQAAIPRRAPQQPRQTAPGYGRHRALAAPCKRRGRIRTAFAHRKAQRIGIHRLGRRTRNAGIRAGIEHTLRMRTAHLEPHAAAKRQDPSRQTHHLTQIRHTRSCRRSAPPRCPWPRAADPCRADTPACARRQ